MVHGGNYTVTDTFAGRKVGKHFCATKRLTDTFREHEYSTLPSASPLNLLHPSLWKIQRRLLKEPLKKSQDFSMIFLQTVGTLYRLPVTSLILQHKQNAVFLPPHPP